MRDRADSAERSPVVELALGSVAAQVIYAAAELGIADRLAEGPKSCAELSDGAHEPSLRRLLLALAGLGIVRQIDRDRFELADAGRPLRAEAPDSANALVRMLCGPEMWRSWGELLASVRSGELAWDRAHGMPVFEYYGRHPESAATFNAAMAEHTRDAAPGILAAGDFSRFRTLVDVGGGDGRLVAEILRAEPELEAVVFDVPEGLAAAPGTLAAAGVAGRCRVETGDFFVAVPADADAYVLKQILHDWDDGRAIAILRNCRAAMAPGARVLIVERTLREPVTPADREPLLVDMLMLAVTGGRERTEREFRDLLHAAGLSATRVTVPLPFGYRVIEAEVTR
jgi:O-methyltransferase